ncbi:unnamed protein product [Danaus chrysippus]|uniref:(African queen) hypothetical protein n=1 Tax=Danaus chrysippus TaxID=151541 RepID=A0A8J2QUT4_9NEOP|nr:unnamed protein product [Danaus chrysippus]
MSLSWPSPAIVKLQNGTDTPFARPITENEGSWIVSSGFLLGVATSFLGGILLDKIGRKNSIILASMPKLCAAISCIFVTEVWMLIIARAIWIFCDCFTLAFVPVYSSEIASIGLGTFFKVSESNGFAVSGFLNYIPLISLILVIFFYSSGIGSLIWLVMAELFDSQSRALGVSLSLLMGTLTIFLTTKYFPIVTLVAGAAATYFFFAAMCVLIGSLIAIFLPETKGKTFQEIQTELQGSRNKIDGCDKENQIS